MNWILLLSSEGSMTDLHLCLYQIQLHLLLILQPLMRPLWECQGRPYSKSMTCLVSCYRAKSPLLEALEVQDGGGSSQMPPGSNLFNVRRAKEGEKVCQVCKRTFWNTDTLRRHQKTHTGAQRYTCTNPNCGRKLASKRSFDAHKATCGVEKTKFCPRKGCEKLFATAEGLKATYVHPQEAV